MPKLTEDDVVVMRDVARNYEDSTNPKGGDQGADADQGQGADSTDQDSSDSGSNQDN